MADASEKKNPTRHVVGKVFALVVALAVVLGVAACLQVADLERGILEVCADQQDGYVQLVIDQINLEDNRDDEEMISDILETLDASSNKYWVFSQDQTMLFVKDVMETNRYKGFAASAYWGTEGAQEFLDGLSRGEVRHGYIELDGVEYLASGSVFAYDGRDYRLCLLSNRAALLDNNDYLGARSRLLVILLVTFGLLVIIPMSLAFTLARARRKEAEQQGLIATLNTRLQDASERLSHSELYDNRQHVWSADALEPFVRKLVERRVDGVHFAQVTCSDKGEADRFVEQASVFLSDRVVRFRMSDNIVVLLFSSGDPGEIESALAPLLSDRVQIAQIVPVTQ